VLGRTRGQPNGEADDDAQSGGPNEQTLSHRTKATQGGATGSAVGFNGLQEGDDVTLLFGGDVRIVEDRHVLRSGNHRFVNVLFRDTGQGWCELTAGQSTTGCRSVVAHGAVDA